MDKYEEILEKIQECHDGHGRWCASTFDVGVTAFMEAGYAEDQSERFMERLSHIVFSHTEERYLEDIHIEELMVTLNEG